MRAQSFLAYVFVAVMIVSCGDRSGETVPAVQQEAIAAHADPIDALRAEAEGGDPVSARLLGNAYNSGDGVEKDRIEAHRWWLRAAELGDAAAQIAVAKNLYDGVVVRKNIPEAIAWLEKASLAHAVEAKYLLGRALLRQEYLSESPDYKAAFELLQDAESTGDPMAIGLLGQMFRAGLGVEADQERGLRLLRQAADLGDDLSRATIGRRLLYGDGVEQDRQKGVSYLQLAAKAGFLEAQTVLANAYARGAGVPMNQAEATEWYLAAGRQGDPIAQLSLSHRYARGLGVERDPVLAHAWANLSAAQGGSLAKAMLAEILLSAAEQAEAERLAAGWKLDRAIEREHAGDKGRGGNAQRPVLSGTAFVVNKAGDAVTNFHVVDGCARVLVRGQAEEANVIAIDSINDIAVIRIPGFEGVAAAIAAKPTDLMLGAEIVVYGFPMQGVLSPSGNITPGVVSALAGFANNSAQIQITAPIQPGSSGSPVINMKGEVVGVVVQKLSDKAVAKAMNVIPQNVNFAINGQTLASFLDSNKVEFETGSWFAREGDTAAVAESARKWTFAVECWK